jgi:small subunit ribosomal protein S6
VNVYEGMYILDSNRYARDPGGVPRQIDDLIKQLGGEMLVSRLWSEQKLAYPIKGQAKGTYWLTYFRFDSSRLTELNHRTKLNENVLRSLVLKIDARLVDTMVAHASSGMASAAPATDESGGAEPVVDEDENSESDTDEEHAAVGNEDKL